MYIPSLPPSPSLHYQYNHNRLTHLKEQIKEEVYDDVLKADSWKKLANYVAVITAHEETGTKTAGPTKTVPAKKKAQVKSTKRKLCKSGTT